MAGTIRASVERNEQGLAVKILIRHPMKTRVLDEQGKELAPAHTIETIEGEMNGQQVFKASIASGISRNPFLAFQLPSSIPGKTMTIRWVDNRGERDSLSVTF